MASRQVHVFGSDRHPVWSSYPQPFSALDQGLVNELSAELVDHVNALSLPAVLVTHDRKLVRALGGQVTLLRSGRVERVGPASELLAELD